MGAISILGERLDGMAVGKSARLADWAFKKEQRDFDKLVNRLRVRKWAMGVRAEGGPRLAALRANANRRQKKRQARLRAERQAREQMCPWCRSVFCVPASKQGPRPLYCSPAHQVAANAERQRAQRAAKTRTSTCPVCSRTTTERTHKGKQRVYCSQRCQDRAKYLRRKAAA